MRERVCVSKCVHVYLCVCVCVCVCVLLTVSRLLAGSTPKIGENLKFHQELLSVWALAD